MYRARSLFAAALMMVCGMAYAIPVPESSGAVGFFSSMSGPQAGFFGSKESRTSRVVRDGSGRVVGVGAAVFSHDAAGRLTHIDVPGHRTTFGYASEASIQPSVLTRDGVTYSITRGEHSVRLVRMQKLLNDDPTVQDLVSSAQDYMGSCGCEELGGPNIGASIDEAVGSLGSWLSIGGFIGSMYEVGKVILSGAASDEALAVAIGLGFFEGQVAVAIYFMGYGLGTIIYNTAGNYIWINWTP